MINWREGLGRLAEGMSLITQWHELHVVSLALRLRIQVLGLIWIISSRTLVITKKVRNIGRVWGCHDGCIAGINCHHYPSSLWNIVLIVWWYLTLFICQFLKPMGDLGTADSSQHRRKRVCNIGHVQRCHVGRIDVDVGWEGELGLEGGSTAGWEIFE